MKVGNQKRKVVFEEGACFNDINFINITSTPPYIAQSSIWDFPRKSPN